MAPDLALPRSQELQRDLLRKQGPWAGLSAVVYAAYIVLLLQLPHDQWLGFLQHVAVVAIGTFLVTYWANQRYFDPLNRYLDARDEAGESERRAAFESVHALPRRIFVTGLLAATIGGALLAASLLLRFEEFRLFSAMVIQAAAISAGLISVVFNHFSTERALAPVASTIGFELGDAAARGRLVKRVRLRTKVFCSVAGVTVVTLLLGLFLQQVRSDRPFERHVAEMQLRYLNGLAQDGGSPADLTEAAERAHALGIAETIVRLAVSEDGALPPGLEAAEARTVRTAGGRGVSTEIDSSHVFAWVEDPGGDGWLVATIPWDTVHGNPNDRRLSLLGVFTAALVLSLLLAGCIATHVGDATLVLHAEAERVAAGNLRSQRPFESDDELGDLGRSFEHMIDGLRRTIGSVAKSSDRLERASAAIASDAASVVSVTADQASGIQQATVSMDTIRDRVGNVAESATLLTTSVDEVSSSILELGAAGEELNGTAQVLEARVDEVSSAIEQAAVRDHEIVDSTVSLSQAGAETSSSMEEMAASLKEVDVNATEMARLSASVVDASERGQDRVRRTIDGMDAIREATETAERVIRDLGRRTSEIGAVVDVIDDVAEETNLLALNAAIIAAQSGESGRAFSVVADQIKELADRVLDSTKEIGGLIRGVQDESRSAVGAIETGSESVQNGVSLAAEAGLSLEEITSSAKQTEARAEEIVSAVRQQSTAAGHVVELMEGVHSGVQQIRASGVERQGGNEMIVESAAVMRDVAKQVHATTREQAQGASRVRESVSRIQSATEAIDLTLREQARACQEAADLLVRVFEHTRANDESAQRMSTATQDLLRQAEALREEMGRFRL